MVATEIARGIGQMPLVGGMTWGFGDDWIWQFRKVDDRIEVVRRNVRFRADRGTPLEKSVHLSYTDSILFSLPIVTTGPSGGAVVDLTPVFMSDLPEFSHLLHGFMFAPDRSSWSHVKGFKDNVEIEVAATYASGGMARSTRCPTRRGVTLYVHYSVSRLPQTGYQPRLADDRVGYFLTVIKDFSKIGGDDQFVRYVNRWDLRKAEPSAAVSPPVTPVIFWVEKTVPYRFRAAVRDGILEWNKAFEKAGFSNAIEVRQQPDDATWDPEDINYNTNLLFLATVASAGPFVGLFGTVWGIMTSFRSIAASRNTSLAVVMPGIAEALLATAIGLFAAIPALIAYNKLQGDVARAQARMESFADEFSSILSRQIDTHLSGDKAA